MTAVPVPPDEQFREDLAAKIRDAFFEARNNGETMYDASYTAADDVLAVVAAEVAAERERMIRAVAAEEGGPRIWVRFRTRTAWPLGFVLRRAS